MERMNATPELMELLERLHDYEVAKPRLTVHLRNETMMPELPAGATRLVYGRAFGDVCIVPQVSLDEESSVYVNEDLLEDWDIDVYQLIADAAENLEPAFMTLAEASGLPGSMLMSNEQSPMVISTKAQVRGAAAILTDAALELLIKRGPSYVIPSSVHELLIFPQAMMSKEDAEHMLRAVNHDGMSLGPDDWLSDTVFVFDPEKNAIVEAY